MTDSLALGPIVIDSARIAERTVQMAAEIAATYEASSHPLVLICVLKGSLFFTADLGRALQIPSEFDCIAVRSYEGTSSSGNVQLIKDVSVSLHDRDVLMVEDIIDTGLTTSYLYEHLERHQPRSLRLAALLEKRTRRQREVRIDFCGFSIPDTFVVGYGLDHNELYRNLPDIRTLVVAEQAEDS